MAKVVTKRPVPINEMVAEYNTLRTHKKQIEERLSTLSTEIKNYALSNGAKDDKGSYYCDNDEFVFGAVAKKSVVVDEKGFIEFLKSKGYKKAITTRTVEEVNEKEIEKLLVSGDITDEDIEAFTSVSTKYSVSCIVKEEMPEVEQTTLPVAASSKPKLNFKRK